MDRDYWLDRWHRGDTGWHRDAPLPWLQKHWPSINATDGARVLVPLCGKSLDMVWLAAQGHPVLGVEFSELAIQQFFDEQGLVPEQVHHRHCILYRASGIEILHADIFDLDRDDLAGCMAIYDRAAFFALPDDMRCRYAAAVYGNLPSGCRGLLVTLEFEEDRKPGPPFSLQEAEVRRLLEPSWHVDALERRDIIEDQPGFIAAGVTALDTVAYRLQRA